MIKSIVNLNIWKKKEKIMANIVCFKMAIIKELWMMTVQNDLQGMVPTPTRHRIHHPFLRQWPTHRIQVPACHFKSHQCTINIDTHHAYGCDVMYHEQLGWFSTSHNNYVPQLKPRLSSIIQHLRNIYLRKKITYENWGEVEKIKMGWRSAYSLILSPPGSQMQKS